MTRNLINTGIATTDDLSSTSELANNAFDNDKNTKWLAMNSSASIKYELKDDQKAVLKSYSIICYDGPTDNYLIGWVLKGSNDNSNWDYIDSKKQEDFGGGYTQRYYNVNNSEKYKYFKFEFKNNEGNTLQLSEIQMFGDLNDNISASGGDTSNGNGMDKAFDNNPKTKWAVNKNSKNAGWIKYNFNMPVIVTNYAITSNDNNHDKDPKDWKLYASNDNIHWKKLDEVDGCSFSSFSKRKIYSAHNNNVYNYYKLVIESTKSSSILEIGEIEFLTVSSGSENDPDEGSDKAFDSREKTKWLSCKKEDNITIKYMNPVLVSKYTITTACKNNEGEVEEERNPKDWEMWASNDNKTWYKLSKISGWSSNIECDKKNCTIKNPAPYLYYKLKILANNGGDCLQIGEIKLY